MTPLVRRRVLLAGYAFSSGYKAIVSTGQANAYTIPSFTERKKADRFYRTCYDSGIFTYTDYLYLHYNDGSAEFGTINFANPSIYQALRVSSPTWAANNGETGNGSSAYISSQFNPTTASSPKMSQDNACLGIYEISNIASNNNVPIGKDAGVLDIFISTRNGSDQCGIRVNDTSTLSFASTNSSGFWYAERSASNARAVYKNGVLVTSDSQVSAAPQSGNMTGLRAGTLYSTRTIALEFGGAAMGATLQQTLYNAFLTYIS